MKIKSLIIFMVYLLLLLGLPVPVIATTPNPSCPDCEEWSDIVHDCVWACKDATCQKCTPVGGGRKACLPCWGDPNRTCCSNGLCCDRDECKECIGGTCKMCGGDPNKICCNGSCCNTSQCYHCNPITNECENKCDPNQSCCAGGPCCGAGQNCCTDYYYNNMLAPYCCGPNQPCCKGKCCDPNKCETCVDNRCQACGGDPNKTCCEGACCNPDTEFCCEGTCCPKNKCCENGYCSSTCWTARTIDASIDSCPDCTWFETGYPDCPGTTTEINSYQICGAAGAGQGGYCECREDVNVVGYEYDCKINFSCINFGACLGGAALCTLSCIGAVACPAPPTIAICIACLAIHYPVCGNPCTYVEKCEKDPENKTPIEKPIISYIGGGNCSG